MSDHCDGCNGSGNASGMFGHPKTLHGTCPDCGGLGVHHRRLDPPHCETCDGSGERSADAEATTWREIESSAFVREQGVKVMRFYTESSGARPWRIWAGAQWQLGSYATAAAAMKAADRRFPKEGGPDA